MAMLAGSLPGCVDEGQLMEFSRAGYGGFHKIASPHPGSRELPELHFNLKRASVQPGVRLQQACRCCLLAHLLDLDWSVLICWRAMASH